MALHCHDYPGNDAGACYYESNFKYYMIHHPFGGLACSSSTMQVVDIANFVDGTKEAANAKKGEKESAASKKNKQMIEFSECQTIENLVLNHDKSDVETLGGTPLSSLSVKAKTAFLRKMKVMIPQNKQTANDLGSVIANWINSQLLYSRKNQQLGPSQ